MSSRCKSSLSEKKVFICCFGAGTGERTVSESRKSKILMIKLIRKVSHMDPEN